MREIRENGVFPTQQAIDKICEALVSHIQRNSKKENDPECKTRRPKRKQSKRKKKRYAYGRNQEIYKKDPGVLAKYIREGTPSLQNKNLLLAQQIIEFYTALWCERPEIDIPFEYDPSYINERPDDLKGKNQSVRNDMRTAATMNSLRKIQMC
jgi:hypothetical protein